jgi:hypothetical protein
MAPNAGPIVIETGAAGSRSALEVAMLASGLLTGFLAVLKAAFLSADMAKACQVPRYISPASYALPERKMRSQIIGRLPAQDGNKPLLTLPPSPSQRSRYFAVFATAHLRRRPERSMTRTYLKIA